MEKEFKYISDNDKESIKESIKSLAVSYLKKVQNIEEEIFSFGIFADSDICGFVFGYNNQEGMNIIKEKAISFNKKFPNEKIPIEDGKWSISEWISGTNNDEHCDENDKRYNVVFNKMEELRKASSWLIDNPNKFPLYKEEMFDIFCEVLQDLKKERRFKKTSKDFFLLVEKGDNGVYGNRSQSLMKIMTKEQYENYIKNL